MKKCLPLILGLVTAAHAAAPLPPARTAAEAGLTDVRALVPDIDEDMRYAGPDNFTGAPVDGYRAPKCLLRAAAAKALAAVDADLRREGYRLRVWDCYRPARAVAAFVRWAGDLADTRTKAAHYPNLGKDKLLGEYIAPVSGHSRGATVDLTLLHCQAGHCMPLDMGTDFDFFDPLAHTDDPRITAGQRANRQRLKRAMEARGFVNYAAEWWHYSLPSAAAPTILDVPVRRGVQGRRELTRGIMRVPRDRTDSPCPPSASPWPSTIFRSVPPPATRRGSGRWPSRHETASAPRSSPFPS